jgi:hypothetical protein
MRAVRATTLGALSSAASSDSATVSAGIPPAIATMSTSGLRTRRRRIVTPPSLAPTPGSGLATAGDASPRREAEKRVRAFGREGSLGLRCLAGGLHRDRAILDP